MLWNHREAFNSFSSSQQIFFFKRIAETVAPFLSKSKEKAKKKKKKHAAHLTQEEQCQKKKKKMPRMWQNFSFCRNSLSGEIFNRYTSRSSPLKSTSLRLTDYCTKGNRWHNLTIRRLKHKRETWDKALGGERTVDDCWLKIKSVHNKVVKKKKKKVES